MIVTFTLNEQDEVLPDASVAVQVTAVVPAGNVEPEAGVQLLVTPGQLSLAVGEYVTAGAVVQFVTDILAGHVIVGGWLSLTMTFCVQVLELPQASVAVQTTEFVPFGNWAGALFEMVGLPPQLSVAVAVPSATPVAKHWPASVLTVTFDGQVMTGAVVSLTVIVCVQVLLLPQASVAR